MSTKIAAPSISIRNGLQICLPFFICFLLFFWWAKEHPFFWDTILLASKAAHFYFEQQFQQLLLPLAIDAGHPPYFGIYLALWWTLLGKSLWVSHLAMLPFMLGIVWQIYRLSHFAFRETTAQIWCMAIVLADATLLGQCSMVSPDVVLVFATLLGVNSVLYQQNKYLVLATLLLMATSIRGLFTLPALYILTLLFSYLKEGRINLKLCFQKSLVFVPVTLATLAHYGYHYWELGWWISTPNEGWSAHRQLNSIGGMLKNIGLIIWRMLDFGRIGLCLLFLPLLFPLWKKLKNKHPQTMILWSIPFTLLIFQLPSLVLIQNPIGHRYLLPFYLTFGTLVVYLLFHSSLAKKYLRLLASLLLLSQLSGHFWVYPEKVAQGWDASLAHVPYFELRQQMIDYLEEQSIPLETVGTEFPNNVPLYLVDLSEKKNTFAYKDLAVQDYILYATVFNDFSDSEMDELNTHWIKQKEFRKRQIRVTLYHRK